MKNKEKIPNCRNISKIKYQNHRKRQNRYPLQTNEDPHIPGLVQTLHFVICYFKIVI